MEKLSPTQNEKQQSFLEEIDVLIAKQVKVQKKQLEEHLTNNDKKFDQKIDKAITKINEKIDEKIKSNLDPLEARQTNSEKQIEILKAQMGKYTEATEENTKIIIESNQQLTKTLAKVHTVTSRTPLDPNISHLRQKLSEDLQQENCILTI